MKDRFTSSVLRICQKSRKGIMKRMMDELMIILIKTSYCCNWLSTVYNYSQVQSKVPFLLWFKNCCASCHFIHLWPNNAIVRSKKRKQQPSLGFFLLKCLASVVLVLQFTGKCGHIHATNHNNNTSFIHPTWYIFISVICNLLMAVKHILVILKMKKIGFSLQE